MVGADVLKCRISKTTVFHTRVRTNSVKSKLCVVQVGLKLWISRIAVVILR